MKDEVTINIDSVKLEQRFGNIIPDVVAYVKGMRLFVEINVFHPVDDNKLKKIREKGINTIEINICDMQVNFYDFDKEFVADKIINSSENKHWLYSRKAEKDKEEHEKREYEKVLRNSQRVIEKILSIKALFKPFENKYNCIILHPKICKCLEQ